MTKPQRTFREELDRGLTFAKRSKAYWKRAILAFAVVMLITVPVVFTRPRAYKSETVILYQETIRSADITGQESSSESNARRVGARLRELLLSRASLEPIIVDLKLFGAVNKSTGAVDKRALVDAVDDMRKQINFRAREGDTFEISYIGDEPQLTQEVTKRLAGCIIQEAGARRAEQTKTLKEFLDAESERNKAELKKSEADLAKFLAAHPEFAAPPGTPQGTRAPLPIGSSGGTAAAAGTTTRSADPQLAALESRASHIERQLKAGEPRPVTPTPTPTGTTDPGPLPDSPEVAAAKRDLADKLGKYTEKHPDVIAAKNRLKNAQAAQDAARAAAPPPTTAPAPAPAPGPAPEELSPEQREALKKQLAQVVAEIAARRAALSHHNAAASTVDAGAAAAAVATGDTPAIDPNNPVALEVEYRRLLLEVTETRERQRQLDEKLFKASISATAALSDRNIQVSILDPAYLPSHPTSGSRTQMLIAGFVLAIVLAMAIAAVSAWLDDRIHDRMDIELLDVMPVVAVIPRTQKRLPPESG